MFYITTDRSCEFFRVYIGHTVLKLNNLGYFQPLTNNIEVS